MHARSLVIAAAALTFAEVGFAEPPKSQPREVNANPRRPATVVLASADQVPTPVPSAQDPSSAPAKPARRGRVTTCRCADQVQH